ncbi:hypothetical protein ACTD5D_22800 [Nocardia takedensis]|uniref:hypothetical protein n=1 Tax=Nocardia takedensis TaxID=259390 RepID=UPI003F770CBF
MKSSSLVADDTPIQFKPGHSKPIAPTDPGYAIQMNEIVQGIIRGSVADDDLIEDGLTQLSGVLVQWLFSIGKWGRADLYDPVIYHAAAVCEHVIEESVENPFTALILGNTGSALVNSGHYELAVDYFTAELSIIKEVPGAELLQVQTSAGLASALVTLADSPREAGDAVLEQIEYCARQLPAAIARDRKEASVVIHGLRDALETLVADGFRSRRVPALKVAFRDMLPAIPDGPKDRESYLMDISLLLRTNRKSEALELIDSVLAGMAPSDPYVPQLVVLAADCSIAIGDWPSAAEHLSVFSRFAEANTVRQTDVGLLVRTVGSACIQEGQFGVLQAHELIEKVVTAVASAKQHDIAPKSAESALLSVIVAAQACKISDITTARSTLESMRISNVPSAGRYLLVHLLYRVMTRWIDTHADNIDSLGATVPLAAPPRTRLAELKIPTNSGIYVNKAPLDTAQPKELPAIHLAMALWIQNQKFPELDCREATAELYYAMQTVGLKPELVRVEFGIMTELGDVTDNAEMPPLFNDRECDGHFVLWFAKLRLMIDPGVMHHRFLDHSDDRESAPDPSSYGPVMRSLFRLPSAIEIIIRRPELTLRYRDAHPVVAEELLRQLTPPQRASALVGGLNTATHGIVRLASADRTSVEAIRKECPEIAQLWSGLTLPSEEPEDSSSSTADFPEFAGEDDPVQPRAAHPPRRVRRSRRWFQR